MSNLDLFWWFPVSACSDNTVHNLNEYIEMRAADVATNVGADLINAVFTEKLGVVIGENQLEEFFSQVS